MKFWLHMTARDARDQGIPLPATVPDDATLEIPPGTPMQDGKPVGPVELIWRWVKKDALCQDLRRELSADIATDNVLQKIVEHLQDPSKDVN